MEGPVRVMNWGNIRSHDSETIELFNAWKSKKSFTVYYDPEDPSDSLSRPSTNGWLIAGGIFTALLAILGLMGIYTALFSNRKNHMLNEDQARAVVDHMKDRLTDN